MKHFPSTTTLLVIMVRFSAIIVDANAERAGDLMHANGDREFIEPEETQVLIEIVNKKRQLETARPETNFPFNLKLRSVPQQRSVFGPGFKYTEIGGDDPDNPVTFSFIPSRKELNLIEANLYSDADKRSFVKLVHHESSSGVLELHGVINGSRIRTRRDIDTGKKSYFVQNRERSETVDITPPEPGRDEKDYLLLPSNDTLRPRTGTSIPAPVDPNAWVNIEPELVIVLDYHLSQQIGGDWNQKLEYAAITVNGINGFYEPTNDSIRIYCELVHVIVIKSEAQQPFITNAGRRVDLKSGRGRWVMSYSLVQVIMDYQKWVVKNAALFGEYDLAPLLAGVTFDGRARGIATTPGACHFNVSGISYATTVASDKGANFEGIAITAHEIGHTLGAPHDGEQGTGGYSSTEECPFEAGFLMCYNKENYTNAFRFSECSLRAIKQYVTTDMAACLRSDHKTGRAIVHESTRHAGNGDYNYFEPEQACKSQPGLNFEGVPSYQAPDEQCRQVKCELFKPGEPGLTLKTSIVPGRYTPCGDNQRKGKCQNGFCIGQGPAVDMHSVCKIATRYAGSQFDSGNESVPLDKICAGDVWWCTSDNGSSVRSFRNVTPAVGTPCGDTKVCFNKECTDTIQDPNKVCILETGKQEATQLEYKHPNPKCVTLIKCAYGTEFEFIGPASIDPDCNPFAAIPVGRIHKKVPFLPYETDYSKHSPTLQEVCESVTKEPGSKVANHPGPGGSDRDRDRNELCSKLVCLTPSGARVASPNATADGAICGPLRRCKNGECVICGRDS